MSYYILVPYRLNKSPLLITLPIYSRNHFPGTLITVSSQPSTLVTEPLSVHGGVLNLSGPVWNGLRLSEVSFVYRHPIYRHCFPFLCLYYGYVYFHLLYPFLFIIFILYSMYKLLSVVTKYPTESEYYTFIYCDFLLTIRWYRYTCLF